MCNLNDKASSKYFFFAPHVKEILSQVTAEKEECGLHFDLYLMYLEFVNLY